MKTDVSISDILQQINSYQEEKTKYRCMGVLYFIHHKLQQIEKERLILEPLLQVYQQELEKYPKGN